MAGRAAVSIVCVWNDDVVRAECLDASVQALLPTAPETEYLPVDNRGQVHTSAGSALNAGARRASNEVVVFVHQDVHLHSLVALEEAAALLLADPTIGVLGAVGITHDGEIVGQVRDRVVLLGRPAPAPVDVDSLDEVLFMARRQELLGTPLTEHPDLAWHAYAVELGMRRRADGRRVVARDLALTHNSMSTNLARLDHAHAFLAALYPDQVPTRTTCGDVVSPVPVSERKPFLAAHRWRRRWLLGSLRVRRAAAVTGASQVVLADMRTEVDRVMEALGVDTLRVVNLVPEGARFLDDLDGTRLHRGTLEVVMTSVTRDGLLATDLADRPTLVTNLDVHDLAQLRVGPGDVLGLHEDLGHWLLTGVTADAAALWPSAHTRPWRLLVPSS